MGKHRSTGTFSGVLDDLFGSALANDVAQLAAQRARAATARALGFGMDESATMAIRRRAHAYFWACLRRETVRGCAGPLATARLVASAVVEDLLETGRDNVAAFQALERGWGERLPADVLDEYRQRLCG